MIAQASRLSAMADMIRLFPTVIKVLVIKAPLHFVSFIALLLVSIMVSSAELSYLIPLAYASLSFIQLKLFRTIAMEFRNQCSKDTFRRAKNHGMERVSGWMLAALCLPFILISDSLYVVPEIVVALSGAIAMMTIALETNDLRTANSDGSYMYRDPIGFFRYLCVPMVLCLCLYVGGEEALWILNCADICLINGIASNVLIGAGTTMLIALAQMTMSAMLVKVLDYPRHNLVVEEIEEPSVNFSFGSLVKSA